MGGATIDELVIVDTLPNTSSMDIARFERDFFDRCPVLDKVEFMGWDTDISEVGDWVSNIGFR